MARFDVHRVTLVSTYDGVNCLTSFHFQELDPPIAGEVVEELCDAFEASWLPAIAAFHVSDVTFSAITARTLKPAMTAQFTKFINVQGDLTGVGLPSTCIQQITVWPLSQASRPGNWYRFSGIPQTATRQGKLDNDHIALIQTFGNAAIGGEITSGGATFLPTTRPRPGDQPGVARPQLIGYWVKPTVLNQRSRQFRVVTG